ncbi:hypothetical protein [Halomonas llamarensis]|uniref:Uncharacterized protein n=1 Tax=Halomonas llamarensis TaxID=2945104 RepID=A0ABT0SVA9_9GAMM|nr:hypothetical protein [Halomonas llamarensis]MCL7931727.1 hypothetical protein [Halomonas llamarensis]
MSTNDKTELATAIGPACTITITPTAHGISVRTDIDPQEIEQNGGLKATQALTQVGLRAMQQVLDEYEQEAKKRETLH